ncbi:hypothetical protein SCMU_14470 [Sinomonas cyclohexanicum]|uniref:Uncharacterized protein n=1 Tax=Sinomonas cyclohexanicum TaxID=322009 RepID=A0ABN6FGD1_SINCY|nr:hypothetical protein [Corynebacterium cyclohexanicum]BCT75605.1 hypothetical protein SCMU_14470 [Corynebacterium cyclohexanicum]
MSVAAPAPVDEAALLDGLDFDPDIPCDAKQDCPHPAVWVATHTCCGDTYPCCVRCRAAIHHALTKYEAPACTVCKTDAHPGTVKFTPIRGGGPRQ